MYSHVHVPPCMANDCTVHRHVVYFVFVYYLCVWLRPSCWRDKPVKGGRCFHVVLGAHRSRLGYSPLTLHDHSLFCTLCGVMSPTLPLSLCRRVRHCTKTKKTKTMFFLCQNDCTGLARPCLGSTIYFTRRPSNHNTFIICGCYRRFIDWRSGCFLSANFRGLTPQLI